MFQKQSPKSLTFPASFDVLGHDMYSQFLKYVYAISYIKHSTVCGQLLHMRETDSCVRISTYGSMAIEPIRG